MSIFDHFFRSEDDAFEQAAFHEAREVLDWMGQAYHDKFEKWLDEQASKPFEIGPKLVESAMRVNTLREVKQHLARLRSDAVAARERVREGANG